MPQLRECILWTLQVFTYLRLFTLQPWPSIPMKKTARTNIPSTFLLEETLTQSSGCSDQTCTCSEWTNLRISFFWARTVTAATSFRDCYMGDKFPWLPAFWQHCSRSQ